MDDSQGPPAADPIPAPLWIIALVALLPFPAAGIVYAYGPARLMPPAMTVIIAWASVVLSFLGGVRWGLETREPAPRWQRQAFSFLCAVAGAVILLARGRTPDTWILAGFIAAFLIQWLFDHQTPNTPSRYPVLSTVVTGAACASLALVLERALHA